MAARNNGLPRKRRRFLPGLETVERREVPATFGAPWTDALHLSASFAPDGTKIASHASNLFQALNLQSPTAAWQRTILQALQTWAARANINIGLTADAGGEFGTPGKTQHDPRFGDIRVGAQPMAADALSVSVPFDPALSGTWSGDMLFNSAVLSKNATNLLPIALHEAGHILGLEHSADPNSVMFSHLNGKTALTAGDVAALQALYGNRAPDAFEGSSGNDSIAKAATIPIPGSYTGQTPLIAFGDVTTASDVDYYAFRPVNGYNGAVIIRLQSAGISLLSPKLTIVDAKGKVLATSQATSGSGDTLSLVLNAVDPKATYFVRVEAATKDAFGVGSYGLAVTFNGPNAIAPATLDAFLRQGNRGLNPNDVAAYLRNPSATFFNADKHSDDTVAASTRLATSAGYPANTHYDAVGSLSDGTDVDVYRIDSPSVSGGKGTIVLTATVRSLGNGPSPRISLMDRDLNPIPATLIANTGGVFTIQAAGLKAGANYYVKVAPDPTRSLGNYALEAGSGSKATQFDNFTKGSLTASAPQLTSNLYVGRSQLFQFALGASGAVPVGVSMEILDAKNQVIFQLLDPVGDTASGRAILLTPGAYKVRFRATSALPKPVAFSLDGGAISDPIGPRLLDPTFTPIYVDPKFPGIFTFPGLPKSSSPYAFALA